MASRLPSDQVITILAALVEERVGLHYRREERELLGDKLLTRAEDAGFESLLDYYYFLRYDDPEGAEMKRLVEALLVHETYLFRELRSLEVAIDHAVVPAIRQGRKARIWSAACSTGEETASLAVLMAERKLLDRCEIIGSDVSDDTLVRARRGRYRGRALRSEGRELAERWLQRDGDEIVVPQPLLDAVELRKVNLCVPAEVEAQGELDLVLCRNVLIYFAEPTVVAVVASLAERLRADATLLVGVSESLLRFSTRLVGEEVSGAFLYRRSS